MTRWPLYPAEVVGCIIALYWAARNIRDRKPGWPQVPVIMPWLVLKAAFSCYLFALAIAAGWADIPTDPNLAFWSHVLLLAGPLSVAVLLWSRWKRG